MRLSPTEPAVVNFDSLVGTTDLNTAALQNHQDGFPAEHAPVCESMCTQAIFILDFEGWFAVHDVIRDYNNFHESEITPLEP